MNCDHVFDGGICLDCDEKIACELCDINPWETRCDECDSGRICDNCYVFCDICNRTICTACEYCSCQQKSNKKELDIEFSDKEYSWKNMSLSEFLSEDNVPSGWTEFFQSPEVQSRLTQISSDLDADRQEYTIYPEINQVFRAFYATPLNRVRVVLVGQDPYHNGSAVGLCFSVKPGNTINPSLKNIYRELENSGFTPNYSGNLTHWAKQGILLLNTALTVQAGSPESHMCHWYEFSKLLIKYIGKTLGNRVQWLLFGRPAFDLVTKILGKQENMLVTTHPSPLGANKSASFGPAFLGSRVFEKIHGITW